MHSDRQKASFVVDLEPRYFFLCQGVAFFIVSVDSLPMTFTCIYWTRALDCRLQLANTFFHCLCGGGLTEQIMAMFTSLGHIS